MNTAILSWYAYAQSVAARRPAHDADLDDPARVVELFNDARRLDAELTPQGWKHLWAHYGLEGLIDLAGRTDWPQPVRAEEVAEALVSESLAGGYDPVSG